MATKARTRGSGVKPAEVQTFRNGYYTAADIQKLLGVGKTYAYQVIRKLNAGLEAEGWETVRGRVSKRRFHEKFYS